MGIKGKKRKAPEDSKAPEVLAREALDDLDALFAGMRNPAGNGHGGHDHALSTTQQ